MASFKEVMSNVGETEQVETCVFNELELALPAPLIEDMDIFLEVVSEDTWKTVLNEQQRSRLLTLLPSFPANGEKEKQKTVRALLCGRNFKFGNPLKIFHKKLRGGYFQRDVARYAALYRMAKQRDYQFSQQVYYSNLLTSILINRERLLESLYCTPPDEPIKFDHLYTPHASHKQHSLIDYNTNRRCHQLIREINKECCQSDTSSDDDEDDDVLDTSEMFPTRSLRSKASAREPSANRYPHDDHSEPVMDTFTSAPSKDTKHDLIPGKKSALTSPHFISLQVTNDDFLNMMRVHKKRKLLYPDHPELDTMDMTLEDVIGRTRAKKIKPKSPGDRNTEVMKTMKKSHPKIISSSLKHLSPTAVARGTVRIKHPTSRARRADHGGNELDPVIEPGTAHDADSDLDENETLPDQRDRTATLRRNSQPFSSFFALIKHIICEDQSSKIAALKLEETVLTWQESESAPELNQWFYDQPNWAKLVASAIKFLSGDVVGMSVDNFVPLIDYKERAQQWKWIGHGRDSDKQLSDLYNHWTENRDPAELYSTSPKSTEWSTVVPPPRMFTDYTVRPSTDEERKIFQAQEYERFENPHRSYVYRTHDYEAVVGPVKGVYGKEVLSPFVKARDHALLVKDRPAYVTILTLVRDGAARLPNGEGTRNDICELLKDSMFLSPGTTDAQINTVVSGALDRLHYEKDPCVKYDSVRKLWIYRHRNRSYEDFEKIHAAHGAAVQARKVHVKQKNINIMRSVNTKKGKDLGQQQNDPGIESLLDNQQNNFTLLETKPEESIVIKPPMEDIDISASFAHSESLSLQESTLTVPEEKSAARSTSLPHASWIRPLAATLSSSASSSPSTLSSTRVPFLGMSSVIMSVPQVISTPARCSAPCIDQSFDPSLLSSSSTRLNILPPSSARVNLLASSPLTTRTSSSVPLVSAGNVLSVGYLSAMPTLSQINLQHTVPSTSDSVKQSLNTSAVQSSPNPLTLSRPVPQLVVSAQRLQISVNNTSATSITPRLQRPQSTYSDSPRGGGASISRAAHVLTKKTVSNVNIGSTAVEYMSRSSATSSPALQRFVSVSGAMSVLPVQVVRTATVVQGNSQMSGGVRTVMAAGVSKPLSVGSSALSAQQANISNSIAVGVQNTSVNRASVRPTSTSRSSLVSQILRSAVPSQPFSASSLSSFTAAAPRASIVTMSSPSRILIGGSPQPIMRGGIGTQLRSPVSVGSMRLLSLPTGSLSLGNTRSTVQTVGVTSNLVGSLLAASAANRPSTPGAAIFAQLMSPNSSIRLAALPAGHMVAAGQLASSGQIAAFSGIRPGQVITAGQLATMQGLVGASVPGGLVRASSPGGFISGGVGRSPAIMQVTSGSRALKLGTDQTRFIINSSQFPQLVVAQRAEGAVGGVVHVPNGGQSQLGVNVKVETGARESIGKVTNVSGQM